MDRKRTYEPVADRLSKSTSIPEPISGCTLWMSGKDGHGYGSIKFQGKQWIVTRLVWTLNNGEIPRGQCVLHRCDTPACCRLDHLFLGTKRQNSLDRDMKGRTARPTGEKHPMARLTERDVLEIRAQHISGKPSKRIAEEFGVSFTHIREIINHISWSHL